MKFVLTFPIPIALYFRLSYFHRSKLNVGVFSVGSCYLAHNMSLLSIYLLPKYTSDASSASHFSEHILFTITTLRAIQ